MPSTFLENDHAAANIYDLEDRFCFGCKKSVMNKKDDLVVAFGQSFFHLDCFCCAKCANKVTKNTNLLLLSDGSPICANCSYSCGICKLPILDEAIVSGDDAYHAHCFKCKLCKNRIEELIFAKTRNSIYCMNCHNDRIAKIHERARRKRERELGRHLFVDSTGPIKSQKRLAGDFHQAVDGQSGTQQPENPNAPRPPLEHQDSLTVPGADGRTLHHQPSTESLVLQLNVPADPESAANDSISSSLQCKPLITFSFHQYIELLLASAY